MMVQFDVKRIQSGTESFMVSFDFTKTPVTQIADYIIIAASKYNASDIHFDPREEGMMVRFRIDGDCQDYTFVPKAYEKNLTTRLKLMANMNITESRLPQDGAIKGNFGDQYLDMRVSALPLNEGEKIVIRILDYTRSLQGIDSLGFHPDNLAKIKRMMGIPNGIILTTGATGSGKSTTTYSILQGLNKPETNIITVEDPIEMNIEGINQVQVNSEIGMTFAAALRSILRQDPNVILIGEIRDSETAQIAVRASITGHLVLSTIHTNNALATVERLLDMDVERYLLATALTGIISQRLGKMLCEDCRYQRETTKYEKKVFKKYLNLDVAHVWDANPKGCEHCRRGYHGRIAFHEVLELDDNIRSALSNEKLEKKELAKMVYSGKTITMLQDALIKCLDGKTSFEEVYKSIEIENEDDDNYENELDKEIMNSIPEESYEKESDDDLLDTPALNELSDVVTPPAFTAEDFIDDVSEKENNNTEQAVNTGAVTVNNTVPETTPTQINTNNLTINSIYAAEQTSANVMNNQSYTVQQPVSPVTAPVTTPITIPVTQAVVQQPLVPATIPVTQPVQVIPQVTAVQQPVSPVTAPVTTPLTTPVTQPVVPVAVPTTQPVTVQQPVTAPVQTTQVTQQPIGLQDVVSVQATTPPTEVSTIPVQQTYIPKTEINPNNYEKLDNTSNPLVPKL